MLNGFSCSWIPFFSPVTAAKYMGNNDSIPMATSMK